MEDETDNELEGDDGDNIEGNSHNNDDDLSYNNQVLRGYQSDNNSERQLTYFDTKQNGLGRLSL